MPAEAKPENLAYAHFRVHELREYEYKVGAALPVGLSFTTLASIAFPSNTC
jgi:hypothetical protein